MCAYMHASDMQSVRKLEKIVHTFITAIYANVHMASHAECDEAQIVACCKFIHPTSHCLRSDTT